MAYIWFNFVVCFISLCVRWVFFSPALFVVVWLACFISMVYRFSSILWPKNSIMCLDGWCLFRTFFWGRNKIFNSLRKSVFLSFFWSVQQLLISSPTATTKKRYWIKMLIHKLKRKLGARTKEAAAAAHTYIHAREKWKTKECPRPKAKKKNWNGWANKWKKVSWTQHHKKEERKFGSPFFST